MKPSQAWLVLFMGSLALSFGSCSNGVLGSSSSSSSSTKSTTSSSIQAIVLDSIGGSWLTGATIYAVNSSGSSVFSGTTDSNGLADLTGSLTVGSSYSITATNGSTYAASEMLNYTAKAGTTVALYCHTLGISGISNTPPVIEGLKYSTDSGNSWTTLSSGATISGPFELDAKVHGVVAVRYTSLSGFGIGVDIDQMPTSTNGYNTSNSSLVSIKQDAVSQTDSSGNVTYLTEDLFNFSGLNFLSGSHTLEIVAYDVANNRVEERIPFTYE